MSNISTILIAYQYLLSIYNLIIEMFTKLFQLRAM